jgi:hypothetical protein
MAARWGKLNWQRRIPGSSPFDFAQGQNDDRKRGDDDLGAGNYTSEQATTDTGVLHCVQDDSFWEGTVGRRQGGWWRWTCEEDAAAAVDCGDLLYGVGWAVWAGRYYRQGWVWASAAAAGAGAAGVESADEFDGGGVGFGVAGGGRILLLGEAGAGQVLGVSGGVAEPGGERVRHGDLSGHLCALPGQD